MTGEADKWRFDDGRRIEVSLGDVDLISVFAREHLTDDKRHEPEWEACKRLRRLVDDAFSDAPVLSVSEKPVEGLRERIAEALWDHYDQESVDAGAEPMAWADCSDRTRERNLVVADAVLSVLEGDLARAEKAEAERDEAIRHVRALMEQELVPGIRDVAGEAASAFLARVSEGEQR